MQSGEKGGVALKSSETHDRTRKKWLSDFRPEGKKDKIRGEKKKEVLSIVMRKGTARRLFDLQGKTG